MNRPPLTPETKQAIRKMIQDELRSIQEQREELEQRVTAAALEELECQDTSNSSWDTTSQATKDGR